MYIVYKCTMYKSDPKNVHTYTHPFRGVYGCIWICIFSCMNNKFTFFYFLEYNLFNQSRNHFFNIGDLSITGLDGDSLERQALSSIAFELMCYKFSRRLRCYDLIVRA